MQGGVNSVPRYMGSYIIACMTRRELTEFIKKLSAPGSTQCLKAYANLIDGKMFAIFEAPTRDALDGFQKRMQMKPLEVLKVDMETDEQGELQRLK